MWSGKVAVFDGPGKPIRIVEESTPAPLRHQIVVKLRMAGICGSDVHRITGDIAHGQKPICFGHEAVGTILALGEDIKMDRVGTQIAVGDRLYWMASTPCQTCQECTSSNPLYCKDLNWPVAAGGPNGAGFREIATVDKKATYIRVPPEASDESVIAFGCAMPTALRGFSRIGPIIAGTDVVIQGAGPVGLASTLLASVAQARSITVIGDPPHRLDIATRLGATATMPLDSTTEAERNSRVMGETKGRGAGVVVEAAGHPSAFPEGFDLLGRNGRYLILGLYSGKAATLIDPIRINNYNLQIIGSLGIETSNYKETVDIARSHGEKFQLDSLVTHRFRLSELEEAIRTVGKGVPVKAVIVPSTH